MWVAVEGVERVDIGAVQHQYTCICVVDRQVDMGLCNIKIPVCGLWWRWRSRLILGLCNINIINLWHINSFLIVLAFSIIVFKRIFSEF